MWNGRQFIVDRSSRSLHPSLHNFSVYPVPNAHAQESEVGRKILALLTSRMGVALITGAVLAAPSRPPITAIEPFLAEVAGEAAFTDEMKKYTGRVLRQMIEWLGGQHVRRAVKITVPSRYRSGSIYRLEPSLQIKIVRSDRPKSWTTVEEWADLW